MGGILRSTADASPLVSFRTTWGGPRSRGETGVSAAGIEGVVGLGKQ
jgi:hypothetical protein